MYVRNPLHIAETSSVGIAVERDQEHTSSAAQLLPLVNIANVFTLEKSFMYEMSIEKDLSMIARSLKDE